MNVRLKKTFAVPALVVSDRYPSPSINFYNITIAMTTQGQSPSAHNVAYDRLHYWIDNVFSNSVLISQTHPKVPKFEDTGLRCLVMPDDPVDQLVGIMLWCKLSAILEQVLLIDEIEISSGLDDFVTYLHSSDESLGPMSDSGWWHDADPNWYSKTPRVKGEGKVISMNRKVTWRSLDLDWNTSEDSKDEIQ